MLQRAMLLSRALPFAANTRRISNSNPTHPTELSSVQVSRASKNRSLSRVLGTIQFISTARRKADPRRGSSRFDRGLEHSLDVLQHEMTCTEFHDSVWGLAIYRCVEGNDVAWASMLQTIQESVQADLLSDFLKYPRDDLLKGHKLHVVDEERFYGAPLEQVREHFNAWAPESLRSRLRPDTTCTIEDIGYTGVDTTPRYLYCLVVDEICLESLEYPFPGSCPAVKLVLGDWESPWSPEEKLQEICEPFHDGFTEYDEEDVGWMYMPVDSYVELYTNLQVDGWDNYVRPPYTLHTFGDELKLVGHWRRKHQKKSSPVVETRSQHRMETLAMIETPPVKSKAR